MRCNKLLWALLGTAAFFCPQPARADHTWRWPFNCCYIPYVTWYEPNSPYPCYFGPPYPETDYRTLQWVGTPEDTGVAVKSQLMAMGIYPVKDLPKPKEGTPSKPPEKGGKTGDKSGDKVGDKPGDGAARRDDSPARADKRGTKATGDGMPDFLPKDY